MAYNNSKPTISHGDCECCPDSIDVDLTLRHNMMMCAKCVTDDAKATIEASHVIDSAIQSKSDILVSPTVANIELKAAIQHNSDIADDMKQFEYTKEVYTRFKTMQEALSSKREEILALEQRVRDGQKEVQAEVAKLRPEHREQFAALDINYKPLKPKTIKSTNAGIPSKNTKAAREELKEACIKYGVDPVIVRMNITKNPSLTIEQAARITSERLKRASNQ